MCLTRQPWRMATIAFLTSIAMTTVAAAQVKTIRRRSSKARPAPTGGFEPSRAFPFAAAPVGELRWKEPRPAPPWDGVRDAAEFGSQCVQGQIFGDITFPKPASEDCLNLNIWTPAARSGRSAARDGVDPRRRLSGRRRTASPGTMATRWRARVSWSSRINYRLGIFGFFAHPELTQGVRAATRRATTACSIRWPRCAGSRRTSRPSAAIRRT